MTNRPALGLILGGLLIAGAARVEPHAAAQQPSSPPQAPTQAPAAPAAQQPSSDTADEKLSFDGEIALWTVSIKPDKTADFEQVMTKLRQALTSSKDPQRQRQAAGWKVVRLSTPLPGGNVGYLHLIHPVVPGADYAVMKTLYEELPDERQTLYELYRGAFAGNVALAVGDIAVDLGAPSSSSAPPPAPSPAPAPTPAPSAPSAPPAAPAPTPPTGGPGTPTPPVR